MRLGEVLVASDIGNFEQIDLALTNSRSSGLPIGLELVLIDVLDFNDLASAVVCQSLIRDRLLEAGTGAKALNLAAKKKITLKTALDVMGVELKIESKNRLGSILVDSECISRNILKECAQLSKVTGLPLGRILSATGALQTALLEKALKSQRLLRSETISREEVIDRLSSIRSLLGAVSSASSVAIAKDIQIPDLLKEAGLIDASQWAQLQLQSQSDSLDTEEAFLPFITQQESRCAFSLLQMIKNKQMTFQGAVKLLQRIRTSCAQYPHDVNTKVSFAQFMRIANLSDLKNRTSGEGNSLSDSSDMEDSWQYLPALDGYSDVSKAFPAQVLECMERNGFLTSEEKMNAATASRQYKLFCQNELSIDQAIVSFHLAKRGKETFEACSGTFPSLAIWLP